MKKRTIHNIRIWDAITSILASIILIAIGAYLGSGDWALPFLNALGSEIIGWVLAVFGALSLFASIGAIGIHRS